MIEEITEIKNSSQRIADINSITPEELEIKGNPAIGKDSEMKALQVKRLLRNVQIINKMRVSTASKESNLDS